MGRGETNAKKRKRHAEANGAQKTPTADTVDTSKPTATFKPSAGRSWTVSIALPGSIIANAQSHELRTILVGQIARALAVFCVDEVVIFSDGTTTQKKEAVDPDQFLVHLLSYLETPPHLRKLLFPIHPNLSKAGTLPSLDLPHHLKPDEWCTYREGVTLPGQDADGTLIEAGLRVPVTVAPRIPENTRVTLRLDEAAQVASANVQTTELKGEPVAPEEPRELGGYYWGYSVRSAGSLSTVFTECTYEGGYDISIGTSERGVDIEDLYTMEASTDHARFKHLLIVFGGVAGLEVAAKNDSELSKLGVSQAKDLFDHWVNIFPGQGSRTIRTEEAIWIGMAGLRRFIHSRAI